MKVRIIAATTAYVGGGEIQVLRVADELRGLGVEVELSTVTESRPDVVHIFGLHPGLFGDAIGVYERLAIPYFISPVFYPAAKSLAHGAKLAIDRILSHSGIMDGGTGHFRSAGRMLRNARAVMVNTQAEAEMIRSWFAEIASLRVIPNAVDVDWLDAEEANEFLPLELPDQFVLNVARVERRKNQAQLIRACNRLGIPLVIAGNPDVDPHYTRRCREAGPVTFLGEIAPRSPILATLYRKCDVFCLPSLCETPGIAALEAHRAGAKVVVTAVGGASEYLGDRATYVHHPRSVLEIERALSQALEKPEVKPPLKLPQWSEVAEAYISAYREALM